MSRAGYVLTGGRSSRMGRDKALLPFRGGTLAQAVARTVAAAAGSATLVGDPRLYQDLGFPVIGDCYPGEGPLGGILTALYYTAADFNLVTACDMPGLETELLAMLLNKAERLDADALVPLHAESLPGQAICRPAAGCHPAPRPRLEPLCAVYHRRILPKIEARFTAGVRKVAEALEAVRAVRFPVVEGSCFQNVNTPEEWSASDR